MREPATPRAMVIQMPPGSLPGMSSFAMAPTIRPMMSAPIKENIGHLLSERGTVRGEGPYGGLGMGIEGGKRDLTLTNEGGVGRGKAPRPLQRAIHGGCGRAIDLGGAAMLPRFLHYAT